MELKTKKLWLHVPVTIKYHSVAGMHEVLRNVKEEVWCCGSESAHPDGWASAKVGKPRTKMPKDSNQ